MPRSANDDTEIRTWARIAKRLGVSEDTAQGAAGIGKREPPEHCPWQLPTHKVGTVTAAWLSDLDQWREAYVELSTGARKTDAFADYFKARAVMEEKRIVWFQEREAAGLPVERNPIEQRAHDQVRALVQARPDLFPTKTKKGKR